MQKLTDSFMHEPLQTPQVIKAIPDRHRWLRLLIGEEQYYEIDGIYYTGGSDLAGPSLIYVSRLPKVRELNLMMTRISDDDLATLTAFRTEVHILDVSGTKITDRGLAFVADMTSLNQLHIDGTLATDFGFTHLRTLPNLRTLSAGYNVGDRGLDSISHLSTLRQLSVGGSEITSDGLRQLQRLTALESLDLAPTVPVDDSGLASLEDLPSLAFLAFSPSYCTPVAVRRFTQTRRDVRVHLYVDSEDEAKSWDQFLKAD